jgi:hypothetical protein
VRPVTGFDPKNTRWSTGVTIMVALGQVNIMNSKLRKKNNVSDFPTLWNFSIS